MEKEGEELRGAHENPSSTSPVDESVVTCLRSALGYFRMMLCRM
jgi:hypothetical protein